MKAIELYRYGHADKAFRLSDHEIPEPGPGELRIRVQYSGLNFADVVARRGLYPDAPKNPAVLGYDVAGEIDKCGEGVDRFALGDKVFALSRFGGYAEYVITKQEAVARAPVSIPASACTALATQACTALFCAEYKTNLRPGDKVLIHAGAGGVGSMLVQLAKNKSCIVAATASTGKQEYIKSLGVDLAIDYTRDDFASSIKNAFTEEYIDHAFDSIGGKVFRKSLKILGPCGTIVSYGAASQISGNNKLKAIGAALGFGLYSPIQFLMKSQTLVAVNMLRVADHKADLFKEIMDKVSDYAERGILKPHVHEVYPVSQIAKAHQDLESRKTTGKLVLEWN